MEPCVDAPHGSSLIAAMLLAEDDPEPRRRRPVNNIDQVIFPRASFENFAFVE